MMRAIETVIENISQYDDEAPLWRVRHGRDIIVQTTDRAAAEAAKKDYDQAHADD